MADLAITDERLTVTLGWWEKLAAGRSHFTLPLRTIVGVGVCPSTTETAGVRGDTQRRLQAIRIPGVTATGVYANEDTGDETFLVSHRDGPGIVLDISGATVDRIIISTPHAERYVDELVRHGIPRVDGDS